MSRIVFAKLCSEVITKKTAQINQLGVKLIKTLEMRNSGNAIFYCVIRICANTHLTGKLLASDLI